MADDVTAVVTARRPGRTALRYALGFLIGLVVLALLAGKRADLTSAWRQLTSADLRWVLAAIAAEGLSLLAFAALQHRVLRLTGTRIPMTALAAVSLANDAIASTVPGEPAVSSAYRFRFYQRYGADSAAAGWTIFTILVAQAIGMSLVLLLGVAVALAAGARTGTTGVTVAGLLIVAGAAAILVRRDLILRLALASARVLAGLTGRAASPMAGRIERTLRRMRQIPLGRRAVAGIVAGATAVWGCDFLCLICSFRAVHAQIPWHGVLLAYGVAQVVGSFPAVPGGLGLVEGSLAVVLAGYGTGRVPAVSATLAFRIVNFWLAIAVGWLAAGLIAWRVRRVRPASDAELTAGQPAQPEPESR